MACTFVPDIDNGSLLKGFKIPPYNVGDKLQFRCNYGYVFQPFSYVECNLNGEWKGGHCVPMSCGDPGEISNAKRLGNNFTFPSKVRYECERGFSGGTFEKYCGVNGQWLPFVNMLSCTEIFCSEPSPIKNGKVTFTNKTVDSIAEYKCDSGFQLIGTDKRTCSEKGIWTDNIPKCVKMTCQNPGGDFYPKKSIFEVGDIITLQCGSNSVLSKCVDQDTWSVDPSSCNQPSISSLNTPSASNTSSIHSSLNTLSILLKLPYAFYLTIILLTILLVIYLFKNIKPKIRNM